MDTTFSRYRFGAIIALIPYAFFIFYRHITLPEWFPFTKPDLGFHIPAALAILFLLISLYLSYRHRQLIRPVPFNLKQTLKSLLLILATIPAMLVMMVVIFALVL
ncbi:hypothetical protein [Inquilinus sp. OTU3971]|uniref:hypothetical protein n=1 Tax=Inquilinus sp. OTU3971 TaxID=3043855 RepID=UPI00313BD4EE